MHFLDKSLPHQRLLDLPEAISDFKAEVINASLRPEAQASAAALEESAAAGEGAGQDSTGGPSGDAMVEMSTIMEGFRYLVNDNTMYPVAKEL